MEYQNMRTYQLIKHVYLLPQASLLHFCLIVQKLNKFLDKWFHTSHNIIKVQVQNLKIQKDTQIIAQITAITE